MPIDYPISASVSEGLAATASRVAKVSRTSSASLGLALTVSRAIAIVRTASVTLGFHTFASTTQRIKRRLQGIGTNRDLEGF